LPTTVDSFRCSLSQRRKHHTLHPLALVYAAAAPVPPPPPAPPPASPEIIYGRPRARRPVSLAKFFSAHSAAAAVCLPPVPRSPRPAAASLPCTVARRSNDDAETARPPPWHAIFYARYIIVTCSVVWPTYSCGIDRHHAGRRREFSLAAAAVVIMHADTAGRRAVWWCGLTQ